MTGGIERTTYGTDTSDFSIAYYGQGYYEGTNEEQTSVVSLGTLPTADYGVMGNIMDAIESTIPEDGYPAQLHHILSLITTLSPETQRQLKAYGLKIPQSPL
jgi:hypothetical protein